MISEDTHLPLRDFVITVLYLFIALVRHYIEIWQIIAPD